MVMLSQYKCIFPATMQHFLVLLVGYSATQKHFITIKYSQKTQLLTSEWQSGKESFKTVTLL